MGAKASRRAGPKLNSKVPFRRVDLNELDFKFLTSTTNLNRDQIKDLFDKYGDNNPDGRMTRETFDRVFLALRPESSEQLDKIASFIFRTFDANQDAYLTFNEFLIGYALTTKGDLKTKLEYLYDIYDDTNDGWLGISEVKQAISGMYELLGKDNSNEKAKELADTCLKTLDHNQEDKITKDEFINGLQKNYNIRSIMMPFNE